MKFILSFCAAAICALAVSSCSKTGGGEAAKADSTAIKNKEGARAFTAAWDANKVDDCVKMMDANYIEHQMMPGQRPGVEGFKEMFKQYHTSFPDMKTEIISILAEGDMVGMLEHMTGTNTGEMMGMPATGKKIDVTGVDWVRMKDGKAVEHWGYMDMGKFMSDLGMPMGGGPASSAKPDPMKK
jgi:steroid delta-isomerase-like uncharacterized protein